MQAPAATAFLFDTALRSDFLLWAAIPLARKTLTRAILATPPQVVREASVEEQTRANETLRHILPVSARRKGLLNDANVRLRLAVRRHASTEAPHCLAAPSGLSRSWLQVQPSSGPTVSLSKSLKPWVDRQKPRV